MTPFFNGIDSSAGSFPDNIGVVPFSKRRQVIGNGLQVSRNIFCCIIKEVYNQVPEKLLYNPSLRASPFDSDSFVGVFMLDCDITVGNHFDNAISC